MFNLGLNSTSLLAQLAERNVGVTPATFLGILLILFAGVLIFRGLTSPETSASTDIIYAVISIFVGLILIFQGWRLDPILQFSQLLLTAIAIFYKVESIRSRKRQN
jgi:uncharacterized membrane protein